MAVARVADTAELADSADTRTAASACQGALAEHTACIDYDGTARLPEFGSGWLGQGSLADKVVMFVSPTGMSPCDVGLTYRLAAAMTLHRGLLWLSGDAGEIDLLARDPQLATLIAARPHPTLLGFLPSAQEKLTARLMKLGQMPRRVLAS